MTRDSEATINRTTMKAWHSWEQANDSRCSLYQQQAFTPLHFACEKGEKNVSTITKLVDAAPAEALVSRSCQSRTPLDILVNSLSPQKLVYHGITSMLVAKMIDKCPDRVWHASTLRGKHLGPTITFALASHPSIECLQLSLSRFTKIGLLVMLEQLEHNSTLHTVSFDWLEHFDDEVSCAFGHFLKHNVTLRHLILRTRLLTPREVRVMEKALNMKHNSTLETCTIHVIPAASCPGGGLEAMHRIDRTGLDMKLALNRALKEMDFGCTDASKQDFVGALDKASSSVSAQYTLLRSIPHLWTSKGD